MILQKALNVREPMQVMKRTWSDTFVFLLNTGFRNISFDRNWTDSHLVIELSAPGISVGGLDFITLLQPLLSGVAFLGGTSGWLEVILLFACGPRSSSQ